MWNIYTKQNGHFPEFLTRGFLPDDNPVQRLSDCNSFVVGIEQLAQQLPELIEARRIREELVACLRAIDWIYLNGLSTANVERAMLLYSYFASAYVHARHEQPATRIPQEIAQPLVWLANKVNRPPILSYASYCLNNWKLIDPKNEEPALDNIQLIQNFCAESVGKRDEDWFILVHVEIEYMAQEVIAAIINIRDGQFNENNFEWLIYGLTSMNATLARMPEQCDPENYYRWVRPYIFGFNDVVYEGCFANKPQTFRGETGAQSSIIPALLIALGIRHQDSILVQHLQEMRDYMPQPHREFLTSLEQMPVNLRDFVLQNPKYKDNYNLILDELIKFRDKHFQYAVDYIYNKVPNPTGTGGTPYIPWLKRLREETESYRIL